MISVHDQLRTHALEAKGIHNHTTKKPSLEELKDTEWNNEFEQLMRNRLIMGAMRYALLKTKISYDSITSMRQRLDLLEQDGNGEHLVDIANICLVMFTRKDHPKFHFKAQDDVIHTSKN